jgi:hypothetical protein
MNKDERVKKTHAKHKGAQHRRPSKLEIMHGISYVGTGRLGIYPGDMPLAEMLETLKPHDHMCLIYESQNGDSWCLLF